jgi:hypothetical protein
MTPQESEIDDWEFEAIQKRYHATHGLRLTIDQAKQVYKYEQLRDTPSDKHYFSIWEEFDFEFAIFRNILSEEQFEDYKTKHQKLVRLNEQQVAQQDQQYLKQLEASKDLLHYYQDTLLPNLESQRIVVWQAFVKEREKIEYLKAEYKKHVDNQKKQILVEHFRHSKALQPKLLQLSLLNHELPCLLPDYFSFRANMEEPTRVIADYLDAKLKRGAEMITEGLKDTLQGLKEFRKENTAKHIGEIKGWHVTIAAEEDNLMFLLLLDREKYGC